MIGTIARELLRRRSYQRLGFVRLKDYTRERLGISATELKSFATVAGTLDDLPAVRAAFAAGALSWTHVRLLCAVATPETEVRWLEAARRETVASLAERVRRHAGERSRGARAAVAEASEAALIDDEPAVALRIACPVRVRALWRYAVELARRMCGTDVAPWEAAEAIAAEGLAGSAPRANTGDFEAELGRLQARTARREHARAVAEFGRAGHVTDRPVPTTADAARDETTLSRIAMLVGDDAVEAATAVWSALACDLDRADAFVLDHRLRRLMQAIRTIEPRTGRLLDALVGAKLYRLLDYPSLAAYVRERLGMSARKAHVLLKIERSCRRAPRFAKAYRRGALSWVRAITILPMIERDTEEAWISRANAVTVRRLAAEVDWALERRDRTSGRQGWEPPPPGLTLAELTGLPAQLGGPAEASDDGAQIRGASDEDTHIRRSSIDGAIDDVQIGGASARAGRGRYEHERVMDFATVYAATVCDGDVRFVAPASVVALFRCALRAHAPYGEPRWRGLERLLAAVIAEWERQPRHRDPVFARDGWRCSVPACSARGPLHDHHLRYRSRGGGNERSNRVGTCAGHHLHGIHQGWIAAWGTAPHEVHWQLGTRGDGPPLIDLIGDCYVTTAAAPSGSVAA